MIKDISKTIVFVFSNKFTGQNILTWSMPYLPFWATTGHYSKFYKRIKSVAANKFENSLVKGRVFFKTDKTDRSILSFPSGAKLDFPYDVTPKDIKIITHHLEGLKMAAHC